MHYLMEHIDTSLLWFIISVLALLLINGMGAIFLLKREFRRGARTIAALNDFEYLDIPAYQRKAQTGKTISIR